MVSDKIDWSSVKTKELEEQVRRNHADDKISELRGAARETARAKESELRSRKDNDLQVLRDQQAASDQAAAPISTSVPPTDIPLDPPAPPTGKERWYRFKLKRWKKT